MYFTIVEPLDINKFIQRYENCCFKSKRKKLSREGLREIYNLLEGKAKEAKADLDLDLNWFLGAFLEVTRKEYQEKYKTSKKYQFICNLSNKNVLIGNAI